MVQARGRRVNGSETTYEQKRVLLSLTDTRVPYARTGDVLE